MRRNKELLVATHLSQLLDLVTVMGGFLAPLTIWLLKKDEVEDMEEQGKSILNFRITMFIYFIICFPLIFFFGIGLLGFLIVGALYAIFPIINAIRVYNNEEPNYPFTIKFL